MNDVSMGLELNDKAILALRGQLGMTDHSSSSYWQDMHAYLRNPDAGQLMPQGFGAHTPRPTPLRRLLHHLLQRRYRNMARHFSTFPRINAAAADLADRQGRFYDLDLLRQAISLSCAADRIGGDALAGGKVCVIGDGFAAMTSLALAALPASRVYLVNLTPTLFFDLSYFRKAWPGEDFALVTSAEGLRQAQEKNLRLIAIQADNQALLAECEIDLVVNIASMQEMNPPVIRAYFDAIRASRGDHPLYFFCCNRERKVLPDGTIVAFDEFPWRTEDDLLIDGLCPWHQDYYTLRPPFRHPYDGPHRYRLARMARRA